tara:strand:+ start:403 stop:585 length:183 start_codon:yes stop_codon:yes gene_type:complete
MTPDERMSAHEEHCEIRYREIQRQLDQHEKRFDKLEYMIIGLYILVVGSVFVPFALSLNG